VLRETVPGLVHFGSGATGSSDSAAAALSVVSPSLSDDRPGGLGHHRILIGPDALHVTALFHPTLIWLDRVQAAFPASMTVPTNEAQTLLDEFVLNVYFPQLEEKVQGLFQNMMSAPDAFHEDSGWKALSNTPLVKVSCHFKFSLVHAPMKFKHINIGVYPTDGSCELHVCYDARDPISSRELLSSNSRNRHAVLSEV
jgi:hypothetical protein